MFRTCEATSPAANRQNSVKCLHANALTSRSVGSSPFLSTVTTDLLFLTMQRFFLIAMIALASCNTGFHLPAKNPSPNATGATELFRQIGAMKWDQRELILFDEIVKGNIPGFLRKFVPITVVLTNGNKTIKAVYYVSPDYLSIGSDADWARIPLTPMTAQRIADTFQCFLPTRKMVDDIYSQATIKLEPVPLYANRDSALIFWHHHLIIEGQRKNRKGLTAGIKKDVVISEKVSADPKPNRVAIYGWHKLDGKAIQPLYTGHVNWYVDYSHGIRLVYRKIKIDNRWMDYKEVLKDPVLRKLLCDESSCDFFAYPTK
ncbi:MAG: hypothetical protein H7Y31_10450 [Chitinophagaceae bacterium]|nr:hypothetical protein [Chitinophagaceae bacterium]